MFLTKVLLLFIVSSAEADVSDDDIVEVVDVAVEPDELPADDTSVDAARPGDIHLQKWRPNWDSLSPGKWVASVLAKGYRIPVPQDLGPYRERNNASARQHLDFVRDQTDKLIIRGVVRRVDKQPLCVNPLTVASREVNGKTKLRMCLDLSRHVNVHLKKDPCKLDTFRSSLALLQSGDYQAVYDLASAYHHIRIAPEHQDMLGFAVPSAEDEAVEHYYVYQRMPFGLATAGQVLTRMLKPLRAEIASRGIRHSIYMDDGHVMAATPVKAAEDLAQVYEVIRQAVIQKIAVSRMSGILIVPLWKSAIFWPYVAPNGTNIHHIFCHVVRFKPFLLSSQPFSSRYVVMQGKTTFSFLALFIRSNAEPSYRSGPIPVPTADSFDI